MADFFKKVSFLSLILLLIITFENCRYNKNKKTSVDSITFFHDFENEYDSSIWKNVCRIENKVAFSGNYVMECRQDKTYSFGFDMVIDDTVKNANALISIEMMIMSKSELNSVFVISVERNGKSELWQSFSLANGFVSENQWYKNSYSLSIPNDVIKNSRLNCYVLNSFNESFIIDDFSLDIKFFNIPTYIEEIGEYEIPEDLKKVTNHSSINVLYSEKEKQIVLADKNDNVLTYPLSLYHSLIIDNDTVEMQNSEFRLKSSKLGLSASQRLDLYSSQLIISFEKNNPNVNFNLETTFDNDVKVLKSSLIIPFINDDFTVYRRNPFVDTCDYQDVYYLDQEGFSLNIGKEQLNLYHPDKVSSIQLDVKNATAFINVDYYYDHLLMRYELSDTTDYYIDNSSVSMRKGMSQKSSFTLSLTNKTYLPRIMPVFDGYESAFIWTEHADWTDIKTHRATYFGSEDIIDMENAAGGFAYYDIPVTKSVFYNNPDSINNFDKNTDFPDLHSTIKTDDSFFEFLQQLKDNGFDICLHTPEQYTSNRENLSEALSFMKEHFASPSWIDHGYNNGVMNNREDMICDGLDSMSSYYVYDLWEKNGVKFPFNASYEEISPFANFMFVNNLMRPYPGFGDAIPLPKVALHPSYPDILLWSTPYTLEPGGNWGWNYYVGQERLDKIVDFRYVFITHIYAPWVTEERGFWEMKNGKIVAKDGFNDALKRISDMRDKHIMLPTTIEKYMTYQQQLRNLKYRVNEDGSIILKNNNDETIKGLSLISVKEMSIDNEKSFSQRKTHSGDEWIIWFDINPKEVVKVFNVNKN